jgi:hypothetical protein
VSAGSADRVVPQAEPGAPGILAIWNDREDAIAEAYEHWYVTEHLPERLGVPGFIAARRYEAAKGAPRFFTSYDLESLAVLASADYLARLASPSPLTRQVMASFRGMMRTACFPAYRSRDWALGGCVVAAYVEQPAEIDDRILLRGAAACERAPRVLGVQVWRAAPDPSHATSSESKLRPGGDRRIEAALVVEVMREQDGWVLEQRVCTALRESVNPESSASNAAIQGNVYRLLGVWQARGTDR